MHPTHFLNALGALDSAMREVERRLAEMRAEHDPLAVHIFVARRDYRHVADSKSGKRHEREARSSWLEAQKLGFRGNLSEWSRLLGAAPPR